MKQERRQPSLTPFRFIILIKLLSDQIRGEGRTDGSVFRKVALSSNPSVLLRAGGVERLDSLLESTGVCPRHQPDTAVFRHSIIERANCPD